MQIDPHEHGVRRKCYAKDPEAEVFFQALNRHLAEALLPDIPTGGKDLPLVYIVGAPRSGTTLLCQLLCRNLSVGFINNLVARFWLRPSVGIFLSKALLRAGARQGITYRSRFGTTEEIHEPHEFGYFWRHWLMLDRAPTHKLPTAILNSLDKDGLRGALENEILGAFQLPVVFKNIICGLQAAFLTEIHPLSLFIHIKRDVARTATSILQSRLERFGSYETWWSLKPSTWPFAAKDAAHEVVMQVHMCRGEIDQELSNPNVHSLTLTYEELCEAPLDCINKVRRALSEMGHEVRLLHDQFAPFEPSNNAHLPKKIQNSLREAISNILE